MRLHFRAAICFASQANSNAKLAKHLRKNSRTAAAAHLSAAEEVSSISIVQIFTTSADKQ
jgi:hypothetical protein